MEPETPAPDREPPLAGDPSLDAQPAEMSAELSGFAGETTSRAVSRAGLWNAFSHLIPQVYLLVQSVAAARFLGPERMGQQSFIAWTAVSVVFVYSRGLPDAVLRFAAERLGRERPGDVRGLVRWAMRIELTVTVLTLPLMAGFGVWRGELHKAWALAGVVCAMNVLRGIPLAVLRARLRWRESSLIGVYSGAVAMAGTVAVLAAGGGIASMFAVEAVVGVGATLYARARAFRELHDLGAPPTSDRALHREVARYAAIASGQAVFAYVVWQRSEFLLLDRWSRDSEIAVYSVAFGGVAIVTRLISAFAAVIPGSVATLYGAGAIDRIKAGYARGVRLLMLLTLPLTAIAAALGPSAIDLVYGDDYERAGTVAVVVLASVPVVALFHLAFGVVQGLGRLRVLVLASIAGTVADLAVAFVLIPDHGAVGAGIANAAAQVAASLVVAAFAARFAKGADYGIARLFRALVAAIAAGGVAWAAVVLMPAVLGIVAGGFAGLGMYAALLRLLRVVHADDRAWLAKNVGPLARFF